jgi:hypothetical protein
MEGKGVLDGFEKAFNLETLLAYFNQVTSSSLKGSYSITHFRVFLVTR